jgi:stress response protein SCP2
MEDVLSTYNPTLVLADNPSKNHIAGGKEPFMTPNGGLVHMGDKRTGLSVNAREPDEVLKTNNPKFNPNWTEVAIVVAMHPPHSGKFKDVDGARLVIKDDTGKELLEANLTHDFDEYDIVQMGSLLKNDSSGAWEFKPVAVGINGDFNAVLAAFA